MRSSLSATELDDCVTYVPPRLRRSSIIDDTYFGRREKVCIGRKGHGNAEIQMVSSEFDSIARGLGEGG